MLRQFNQIQLTFLLLLFPFLIITPLFAQEVIDFETPQGSNWVEGVEVFEQFWDRPCGVRFFLDHVGSNNHPVLAMVGAPQTAFYGVSGASACGTSGPADMPLPSANAGCFFLTDDGMIAANTPPADLWIEFNNLVREASGVLLDVDTQEEWEIQAYDGNTAVGSLLTINSSSPGWGHGDAAPWEIALNNPNERFDRVQFHYVGGTDSGMGLAFDNFHACGVQEATYCCEGDNLIDNGHFELGNSGFISLYTAASTIAANSIRPGEFAVIRSDDAAIVTPIWDIRDHGGCTTTGDFMVVNGRTGQTGYRQIYSTTLNLDENKEYKFCGYFKNLPQCANDVLPEIRITASGNNVPIVETISTSSGNCDWQEVSFVLDNPGLFTSISIMINESGMGDGNDLALDDLSVQEVDAVDPASVSFNITPMNVTATTSSYFASLLPFPGEGDDCFAEWSVCELDPGTGACIPGTEVINPIEWQASPGETDFQGYDGTSTLNGTGPGVFQNDRVYQISYAVGCHCMAPYEGVWTTTSSDRMANPLEQDHATSDLKEDGTVTELTMESIEGMELTVYPNPTQNLVNLEYALPFTGKVTIDLLELNGRRIETLVAEQQSTGHYTHAFSFEGYPSGMYFIRVKLGSLTEVIKIVKMP